MIVTTVGELIKSLKKYPKSAHKEVVGLMWYRKKFFKDDVENEKFLTDEVFKKALKQVWDEAADEQLSEQIIGNLQQAENMEVK